MDKRTEKTSEKVILILNDNRIEASKYKLAKYSLYFASLFSENFSDHRKNEYPINYGISMTTLKDFVHWAEHTKQNPTKTSHYTVEPCLEKFRKTHDSNILELLELSVVFMCEKLTNDLTSIIILHWLYAEKIIEIWTLAQELGLEKLGDVALGACLDRFEELPFTSITALSLENLMKLIGNVNVRSSDNWLRFIAKEGIRSYRANADHDSSNHLYKLLLKIAEPGEGCLNERKRKGPKYVSCVVAQKTDAAGKIPCIYWWKRKNFTELIDLRDIADLMDNGKEVFGRQIIGRGFSIYVIGGEQGLGSGKFNKTIWRYCLLSRTWFAVAELPRPRRHMAVEFLQNKLYLIGGVGHHRLKLSSVDVLDIHTGLWSKAADIPEMFTEVPASCVINGKLIYYKTNFYIYDPQSDYWSAIILNSERNTPVMNHVDSLISCEENSCCNNNNVYIGVVESDSTRRTALSRFSLGPNRDHRRKLIHEWPDEIYRQLFNGTTLINFSYNNGEVTVEEGTFESINSYQSIRTYTRAMKSIHESGFQRRLGCFNVIDPSTLHQQIPCFESESINV